MSRTELFRLALSDPRYIPVLRATLQDKERMDGFRQSARPEQPSQVA